MDFLWGCRVKVLFRPNAPVDAPVKIARQMEKCAARIKKVEYIDSKSGLRAGEYKVDHDLREWLAYHEHVLQVLDM